MSDQIETERHGYVCRYDENKDVWRCYALDLEAKTLSALAAKIGAISAASRKLVEGEYLVIGAGWGTSEATPFTVASIDANGKDVWGFVEGWEHWQGSRRKTRERKKFPINSLAKNNADAARMVKEWETAQKEARDMQLVAQELQKAIPRVDADELVRLYPVEAKANA